jgi:hypothetical protein
MEIIEQKKKSDGNLEKMSPNCALFYVVAIPLKFTIKFGTRRSYFGRALKILSLLMFAAETSKWISRHSLANQTMSKNSDKLPWQSATLEPDKYGFKGTFVTKRSRHCLRNVPE